MSGAAFHLPQEVWFQVCLFLSDEEKGNVRSSCKYFKRLIDHPSMWRNSSVVLKKIRSYNSAYWATLRRRKISKVVIHKAGTREWELIATSLPWLREITIDKFMDVKALGTLQRFKNLNRLVIRSFQCPSGLATVLAPLRQLTHICLCDLHRAPRAELISALSQLTGLTSLFYHEGDKPISSRTLQSMLVCLPNLTELSLKMGAVYGTLPDDYFHLPKTHGDPTDEVAALDTVPNKSISGREDPGQSDRGLTRLELLNYMDPILSPVALEPLHCLQSLTVCYRDRAVEPSRRVSPRRLCAFPAGDPPEPLPAPGDHWPGRPERPRKADAGPPAPPPGPVQLRPTERAARAARALPQAEDPQTATLEHDGGGVCGPGAAAAPSAAGGSGRAARSQSCPLEPHPEAADRDGLQGTGDPFPDTEGPHSLLLQPILSPHCTAGSQVKSLFFYQSYSDYFVIFGLKSLRVPLSSFSIKIIAGLVICASH